jgi:alpha-beta hydrolase superfamily lysophospholipase
MGQTSGTFDGINECELYYKTWLPDENPRAALLIVHGVGEHIDRYQNLVSGLVKSGYALAGYDQRGHGRSEGQRGHINSWDDYRGDLREFIKKARQMLPNIPMFLLGHSLGALIVLDYLIHGSDGLSGAILSGTALDPVDAAPPVQKFLAQILSGIYPTFTLKVSLPGKSLSRDPQVAKAYDEDPMVFWVRTARWGAESLNAIKRIEANADKIRIPVLFIHGEKDPLVTAKGAQRFFDRLEYADKTIHVYKGNLHETHNDLDYHQVVADIEHWLSEHL